MEMATISIIVLCVGMMPCISSLIIAKNFREVFLDETWIQNSETTNIQTTSPVITRSVISTVPSALCAMVSGCRIICQQEVDSFIMLDIFVLPFVNESSGNNALKCWTVSRGISIDLNTVSVAARTSTYWSNPVRQLENLLDGIYNFAMDGCWFTSYYNKPYALFDLQNLTARSKVTIVAQNNLQVTNHFLEIEIRLGTSLVSGNDFSSYTLLGYYNSTPSPSTIYEVIPLNPQVGRFLTIQRMKNPSRIQVCHLEIYT